MYILKKNDKILCEDKIGTVIGISNNMLYVRFGTQFARCSIEQINKTVFKYDIKQPNKKTCSSYRRGDCLGMDCIECNDYITIPEATEYKKPYENTPSIRSRIAGDYYKEMKQYYEGENKNNK